MAPWDRVGEALIRKGVPGYLIRLLRDYLKDRQLITENGTLTVMSVVPQGSVIGPLLWNFFYDDLLRTEFPREVQLVDFVDDVAVIGTAHTTDLLEEAINPALSRVNDWMAANVLKISTGCYADQKERLQETDLTHTRRGDRAAEGRQVLRRYSELKQQISEAFDRGERQSFKDGGYACQDNAQCRKPEVGQ